MPDFELEQTAGCWPIAGVDEAGRGPLSGPVVAAAVIWAEQGPPADLAARLDDSKKLSATARAELEQQIKDKASCWAVAEASVAEIDRLNILQSTLLAMRRAVEALDQQPRIALIDGNRPPSLMFCTVQTVIKGDAKSLSIAAASILAKTARDREMARLDALHPGYGWAQNQGYPTKAHMQALQDLGVTPHHRASFRPVREALRAMEQV
ncbi:MAG: ribonuclease HII [Alphaproteobacteria bacterium]